MTIKEKKEIVSKVLHKIHPEISDFLIWMQDGFLYYSFVIEDIGIKAVITEEDSVNHLIFSHKFAKIFWGDEPHWREEWHQLDKGSLNNFNEGEVNRQTNWAHHLQQMILEEEPLKYLEKFL